MAAKGRAGRVDEKNDLRPKENHGYHTKYKGWESYFGIPAVKKRRLNCISEEEMLYLI